MFQILAQIGSNTNHVTEANSWILDFAKIRLRTVPLVLVDHQAQLLSFSGNLEGRRFYDKILLDIKYRMQSPAGTN